MERYDIAALIAKEMLLEKDMAHIDMTGYECEEGKADIVCQDERGCHIIISVQAVRHRGCDDPKPTYNVKKMRRVLMCYLADHPEVKSARYDHLLVTILTGNGATVTYTRDLASKER